MLGVEEREPRDGGLEDVSPYRKLSGKTRFFFEALPDSWPSDGRLVLAMDESLRGCD